MDVGRRERVGLHRVAKRDRGRNTNTYVELTRQRKLKRERVERERELKRQRESFQQRPPQTQIVQENERKSLEMCNCTASALSRPQRTFGRRGRDHSSSSSGSLFGPPPLLLKLCALFLLFHLAPGDRTALVNKIVTENAAQQPSRFWSTRHCHLLTLFSAASGQLALTLLALLAVK